MINRISTEGAWICYGGYNDPTWIGSLYEFNIYSGQMDPQTAALHAIDFPIEDSTSDAALSDLMLDGVTIDDFSPYRLSYDVVQPEGTTTVPLVTATTRISTASAVVTDAEEVNDTATVVVTAEDGITTVTYMVIFSIELSDEATLSDLTVDGITVDGFDPDKISYTVELPYGTTVVPTVAGTATDMNADVVVNPAADLPGTTTVVVTAEDGKTVKTYSIKFELGTAVKKLNGSTIKVYPTVSDGSFMVETPGVISTVTVYDITGRVVLKQTGEGYEQTISVPYAGIYIVKVDCEGATKIFKVFKIN
jgi:hypothetical protein